MPNVKVQFDNNDNIAHAVFNHVNNLSHYENKFSLRPYNYHSPEFTEWWLIPSKEWPAFRHNKFIVSKYQSPADDSVSLLLGFHTEKGLGKDLTSMHGVKKSNIMQEHWRWYKFIQNSKNGYIESSFQDVISRSGQPLVLTVDIHEFNNVPRMDEPEKRKPPHDRLEFEIQPQNSSFKITQHANAELSELNTCANIKDLASRLDVMKGLDYFWLNLMIGICVDYGNHNNGIWNASDIWDKTLEPWNKWVMP